MLLWVMGVRFEKSCIISSEMSAELFQDFKNGYIKLFDLV